VSTPAPITEDWLKEVGFKWHQLDRLPDKHWLLWLGGGLNEGKSMTCYSDIGLEVAPAFWKNASGEDAGSVREWFCWFRADTAGRYSRFIHIRHLTWAHELIALIEAITGQKWEPANNIYGSMHKPEHAARIRRELERIDHENTLRGPSHLKHSDIERDDTRGGALPQHLEDGERSPSSKSAAE
jgi:hypothetical protein